MSCISATVDEKLLYQASKMKGTKEPFSASERFSLVLSLVREIEGDT